MLIAEIMMRLAEIANNNKILWHHFYYFMCWHYYQSTSLILVYLFHISIKASPPTNWYMKSHSQVNVVIGIKISGIIETHKYTPKRGFPSLHPTPNLNKACK